MTTALFSCMPQYNEPKSKICLFEGVSPCRDSVSHLICNGHAEIFGITYRSASYHNGDNDVWTRIVTYVSSNNSLNIPLFVDSKNKILLDEIRSFAINAKNNFSDIRLDEFQARISCLVGLNPYGGSSQNCRYSWFDETNSYLIVRNNNGDIRFFERVPKLHKALFYYTQPSNIKNSTTGATTYLITNVSLTYNDTTNTYAFVVPNKSILLKWTSRPDNVATPIIIDGARDTAQQSADRTYKAIQNYYNC